MARSARCLPPHSPSPPSSLRLPHFHSLPDHRPPKRTNTQVHLSYLPLAHIFETVIIQTAIFGGAAIGFYQGDTLKILEDLSELRPTFFISVPRLYNRIYDKILGGLAEKSAIAKVRPKALLAAPPPQLCAPRPLAVVTRSCRFRRRSLRAACARRSRSSSRAAATRTRSGTS